MFAGLSEMIDADHRSKIISQRTRMNQMINFRAYPDLIVEKEFRDQSFITSQSNGFQIQTLINKIKIAKHMDTNTFISKEVYDLDTHLLNNNINNNNNAPDIPNPNYFTIEPKQRRDSSNGTKTQRRNSKKQSISCLQFESRFESGNLRRVVQIGEFEYNLFLTPDVHLTNGLQWFYFQISNMIAGESYTFNIINFVRVNSQFNYGLQPVMFSVIDHITNSIGWRKSGEKIIYYGSEYHNENTQKQLRTLSFTVKFPYNDDYCYLAYHYPYTYTKLMTRVSSFLTANASIIYSRTEKLCSTVNGCNDVPLLTITSSMSRENIAAIPFNKRPLIFLTARVHPCETNASWIMDGVLEFLLDEQDEQAVDVRDRFVFKIVPMLNPEGVIYGNSRCGLTGHDLNRCWKRPDNLLHPEIFSMKELVRYAKDVLKKPIITFVDIHGHSRKKYFFLYGCNPKLSWNENDRRCSVDSKNGEFNSLPKALSSNESMKLHFCRFNIEKKRESTCRIVMWREFGIKRSYTLECSYCSGFNKKKMTITMLQEIGTSIITALLNLQEAA